jgi:Na+/H+-dicarboxylate symporter
MIVTAMIMAIQRLRNLTENGGKAGQLARWTVGYYILTTIVAVCHSCIMTAFVWSKLMQPVSQDQLDADADTEELVKDRSKNEIHDVVVQMFESFIPSNIVNAMATDSLLAVLVTAVVLGMFPL